MYRAVTGQRVRDYGERGVELAEGPAVEVCCVGVQICGPWVDLGVSCLWILWVGVAFVFLRVFESVGVWEMVLRMRLPFAWVEEGNHGCWVSRSNVECDEG